MSRNDALALDRIEIGRGGVARQARARFVLSSGAAEQPDAVNCRSFWIETPHADAFRL